jgi:5'-nucleotidase
MNILLTNDDGIDSPGLRFLAEALKKRGPHRVLVLAPDMDCSGFSHSIRFLWNPIKISRRGDDAWACSGSPADCVILALLGALPVKPDLVISGINRGANMGTDLVYSGTAAAARQASLGDVPAIALSLAGTGEFYWDMAVSWTVDHLEELRNIWAAGTFVNVNIPNSPGGPGGMADTFPARMRYHDKLSVFEAPDGNSWYFVELGTINAVPAPGSDWEAVSKNLVAVSPVFIHPLNGPQDGGNKG